MRYLLVIPVICLFASVCFSATIYVPDNHPTIQDAINASVAGDKIVVRPGTYYENIDFIGKDVCVVSEFGPEQTIIDGSSPSNPDEASVVLIRSGEGSGAVLDGFTLTNGTGSLWGGAAMGGGIFLDNYSSPTIVNNIVVRNTAEYGGALSSNMYSAPNISGNTFSENEGSLYSTGGLYFNSSSPRVIGNRIINNSSIFGDGGGIVSWYSTSVIDRNVISNNFGGGQGGGIFCMGQTTSSITNNIISGNVAFFGGGIACAVPDSCDIRGNSIYDNRSVNGGGVWVNGGSAVLENNRIWGNRSQSNGGGLEIGDCSGTFIGNTIWNNEAGQYGGGMRCYGTTPVVVNSIFWGNRAPDGQEIYVGYSTGYTSHLDISYCDVKGGAVSFGLAPGGTVIPGQGLIDADPLFHDPENGNFHLRQDPCQKGVLNPCIDAGDPLTPLPNGATRTDKMPDGGVIDLGYHDPLEQILEVPQGHATLQGAIDAADEGDVIVVSPGTYYENIDFKGKNIVVRSASGAATTVIDGGSNGSVVTFRSGEGKGVVLQGFTVTNGNGQGTGCGGGIFCEYSSPTISNNEVVNNTGDLGAGIYCFKASPHISGNLIMRNTVPYAYPGGGGMSCFAGSPTIEGNVFQENVVGLQGGGLYVITGSPLIKDNLFSRNSAQGGGAIALGAGTPYVTGNLIMENTASYDGAAISIHGANYGTYDANVIVGNNASGRNGAGGAIFCQGASSVFTNCVIDGNRATEEGGAFCVISNSNISVTACTVVRNTGTKGGGVYCNGSVVTVINTILFYNQASQGPEGYLKSGGHPFSTLTISYSDIVNYPLSIYVGTNSVLNAGPGIISADPLLYNRVEHDYHLEAASPCRDTGASLLGSLPENDFEGDLRTVGAAPDIGADEFHPHLYAMGKVSPGRSIDIRVVGEPGDDVFLVKGAGVRAIPLEVPYGHILLKPPFVSIPLGPIPPRGVLSRSIAVPGSWIPGQEHYFQSFSGKDVTNLLLMEVK